MKSILILMVVLIGLASGCNKTKNDKEPSVLLNELADIYYNKAIERFPEYDYYRDEVFNRHDQISSNTIEAIERWENFEDSLYSKFEKIDHLGLKEQNDRIVYWILKEQLERSIGLRVCKSYLWDINHRRGWVTKWLSVANFQPVDTENHKKQAFTRWNKFPEYVKTEIEHLRLGMSQGYTMPKEIVTLVIDQMQVLQDYKIEDSPFMSPAKRSNDTIFSKKWKQLVNEKILNGIVSYKEFLQDEYLEKAREEASILKIPNGDECYKGYIRSYTTTKKTGEEIFDLGRKIVEANKEKVIELGTKRYNTKDFSEIIRLSEQDSTDYFKTSEEILQANTRLLEKAKIESTKWFAKMPSTEVILKPYEVHEAGRGGYERATKNKPAYFRINLKNPEKQQKGNNEILTYHEAYPGHHLQIGIELDLKKPHPINKLVGFGSYSEGWARYSEQLAEEMGLYENFAALIERRAWPARGMVVDPGVHLKGWSKERAMDYMMESGTSPASALALYRRIIIWPSQLTSYDVGGEEIKALRKLAEEELKEDFDIREFNSEILKNGAVPLLALRAFISEWINQKRQD